MKKATLYAFLKTLVRLLYSSLSAEQFTEWADAAIELAREKVKASETQVDDELLLPLLDLLDKAFGKTEE